MCILIHKHEINELGWAQGEKKNKNGYPESSKVCYRMNLKKNIYGAYETTV